MTLKEKQISDLLRQGKNNKYIKEKLNLGSFEEICDIQYKIEAARKLINEVEEDFNPAYYTI